MTQLALTEAEIGTVDSDMELTPPEIFEPVLRALDIAEFDLDPCSHTLSLVPARRRIIPPEDGLTATWEGLVWCNWPYSNPRPWTERCAMHHAVGLGRVDTTAKWWKGPVWKHAHAVLFLYDRVGFIKPGETSRSKAPFSSALAFWNHADEAVEALDEILGKAVWL